MFSKIKKLSEKNIKLHYPNDYSNIIKIDLDVNFSTKVFLYINNLSKIPTCNCGTPLTLISIKKGFRKYCSNQCARNDNNVNKKAQLNREKNNLKKYGVKHNLQRKEIIEKVKATNLNKYGNSIASKSNKIKEKVKQTNLDKYGVEYTFQREDIKNKIKQTNLDKYGVEYNLQRKKIIEKIKQTNLDKYGVEYNLQRKEIIEKIKQTNLKKYGVEHPMQLDKIKEKVKQTNLKKYGVEYGLQNEKVRNKISKTLKNNYNLNKKKKFKSYKNKIIKQYKNLNIKEIYPNNTLDFYCDNCKKYTNIPIHLLYQRTKYKIPICLECNPLYSSSIFNKFKSSIEDNIKQIISIYYKCESNRSILNGQEIDIYIPELKLGFEFNGIYWHSELYKDKNYHLNKTKLANEKGVKLIHIWEDDWLYKEDIVKSRILNLIGKSEHKIFARKTVVKPVTSGESKKFLNNNHIQGALASKVKLGLFYEDELVSLMTFGKLRKNLGQAAKENEWEMYRFCNKLHTSVVGGASKLFKHFLREYKPLKIISYANTDWTPSEEKNLYVNLGFKLVGHTGISYHWTVDGKRENRFKFRKNKLIEEGANPVMTEVEIMHDKGYYRTFETGNWKFEF